MLLVTNALLVGTRALLVTRNYSFHSLTSSIPVRHGEEVMLAAVRSSAATLRYASARIRRSSDLVLAAVESNPGVIFHADESLQNSKDRVEVTREMFFLIFSDASSY